jgi:cardiolipin synthase A/B
MLVWLRPGKEGFCCTRVEFPTDLSAPTTDVANEVQPPVRHTPGTHISGLRLFTEQAFLRTTGSPLVPGNSLRILKDSTENYPAWLEAIAGARSKIYFENYIIGNDVIGRQFIDALAERARSGVLVRLLYDWLGTRGVRRLFQPLLEAGGEVRCFNAPRIDSPLGWLSRDHRKSICVDGRVAFVTGLCAARRWVGDPAHGVEPWRDTGIQLSGPAVADVERAFSQVWAETGARIPDAELTPPERIQPTGHVPISVVATAPSMAGLYRLDQVIATAARRTLWLTDAYFVGVTPYVQALRAAAMDGVDVRLLVPGSSDIPWLTPLTRSGYRPLLEAGVRIFEWNGPMMHAKTAVADAHWARVGSSNLNLASWMGNYELDVAVVHEGFARDMESMYERDLENATEIILNPRNRVQPTHPTRRAHRLRTARAVGSAGRAAAGALRIGNTVGAALTNRRILGPAESGLMLKMGFVLMVLAPLGVLWPEVIAVPFGIIAGWIGLSLAVRAWRLRKSEPEEPEKCPAPPFDKEL